MICSGKQVELESYELSSKSGLISKCIYVNELLLDAKMSESNLESDPVFTQNGKTVLLFSSTKGTIKNLYFLSKIMKVPKPSRV